MLVDHLLARLNAIEYGSEGRVELLVETPAPGVHLSRDEVHVLPGKGFAGDHDRKSFYRGSLVPGREVTAMNIEVLEALDVDPLVTGDNLFVRHLNLGALEPGSTICIGGQVILERSMREHRPCRVFRDRTSPDVFRAVSRERYRGTLFVVRTGGLIRTGDNISAVDTHRRS
jgi:MOSC domain-containing protein YiiM